MSTKESLVGYYLELIREGKLPEPSEAEKRRLMDYYRSINCHHPERRSVRAMRVLYRNR